MRMKRKKKLSKKKILQFGYFNTIESLYSRFREKKRER